MSLSTLLRDLTCLNRAYTYVYTLYKLFRVEHRSMPTGRFLFTSYKRETVLRHLWFLCSNLSRWTTRRKRHRFRSRRPTGQVGGRKPDMGIWCNIQCTKWTEYYVKSFIMQIPVPTLNFLYSVYTYVYALFKHVRSRNNVLRLMSMSAIPY